LTSSIADFIAPQDSCPKTKTNFAPDTLQPYSILTSKSSFTKLPATLPTKRSPIPLSKTSQTGTLLSKQNTTTAFGYCPCEASRTKAE